LASAFALDICNVAKPLFMRLRVMGRFLPFAPRQCCASSAAICPAGFDSGCPDSTNRGLGSEFCDARSPCPSAVVPLDNVPMYCTILAVNHSWILAVAFWIAYVVKLLAGTCFLYDWWRNITPNLPNPSTPLPNPATSRYLSGAVVTRKPSAAVS
jgi:hypothetical protein